MLVRKAPLTSGTDTEIDLIEREMEGGVFVEQPSDRYADYVVEQSAYVVEQSAYVVEQPTLHVKADGPVSKPGASK